MNFDKPFWYVGTPYTLYPYWLGEAFKVACQVVARLWEDKIHAFSPIVYSYTLGTYTDMPLCDHDVWIPFNKPFEEMAGGLIVVKMPTWQQSHGLEIEIDDFDDMNKSIVHVDLPIAQESISTLKREMERWG